MQLLKIPVCMDDMHHSLSLTGVTILKKAAYKQRHELPKDLIQVTGRGIVKKATTDWQKIKPKKKISKKVSKDPAEQQATRPAKEKNFTINKKEVTHRIHNYINQMSGEKLLYFWTISFPVNTKDKVCYSLLNRWLTRLRTEKMIGSYLWIVERQQNGTIHFHVVINKRMCVKKANKFMRASIMHSINDGSIEYDRKAAMIYNGVDIAKDRKTKRVINFAKQSKQKSLARYLTKYVTKNEHTYKNLAWHCSREYSNLVLSVRISNREWADFSMIDLIAEKPVYESEWFSFHPYKTGPPPTYVAYLAQLNRGIIEKFNLCEN